MAINHQHLRAFDAVASEGSFSRAARRMNVSQPTLSQQIKALEGRYGQLLFEGRRTPLRLTPVGRELHALTRRIFDTSDRAEALLRAQMPTDARHLRLVADSPVYAVRLARALLALDGSVRLEVQIANAQETSARLADARADLAIVSDPQVDERFAYTPLFVDRLDILLPRDDPRADAASFPIAALADACVLMREATSKTRAAAESVMRMCDIQPRLVHYVHSREAIREAIAIGMGISPMFASECPVDPRLVSRPLDHQPSPSLLTGYLACRADQRRSALMRWVHTVAADIAEPPGRIAPPSVVSDQLMVPDLSTAAVTRGGVPHDGIGGA